MQVRFQRVVVAGARRLAPPQLGHPARDLRDGLRRPVVGPLRPRGQLGHLGEPGHGAVERGAAVQPVAPPRAVEVTVLGQVHPGAPQELARRRVVAAHLAPQEPPHALGRVADDALEPGVERLAEKPLLLLARGDVEDRVDARLHRPLAQQVGAERMDGADGRHFESSQRRGEALALLGRAFRARRLQLAAQAQLHLARRQVGEGDGQDAVEPGAPRAHQLDDARHQLGGLARPGRRLDDESGVQVAADALAGRLVLHGIPRSLIKGCSRSCDLRFTRCSSCGPQTAR